MENTDETFLQQVQNCYKGVTEYIEAWRKLDGAGTHLLDTFQTGLKDSSYESLGQETCKAFKVVHSESNGVDGSGHLTELEKLLMGLKSHVEVVDEVEKTQTQLQQVLCQCVLLFLRVQSDYHQMCSITIAKLLQNLVKAYATIETKDVLQQMYDLDLLPKNSRHSPTCSPSLLKKKSPSSSPKVQAKHGALKSSFLSLFEKKNPSEESKSSFYVDLDKSHSNQSEMGSNHQTVQKIQSDVLIQIGLDPVKEDEQITEESVPNFVDKSYISPKSSAEERTKSQLATEEDLDSVINLLSGFVTSPNQMHTIPENHMQLTVPQMFSSRTPSPRDSEENMRISSSRHQRHSDGALDLTGVGHMRGNTWPHRSSLPSASLTQPFNYPDYVSPYIGPSHVSYHGYPIFPSTGNLKCNQYGIPEEKQNSSRTWPFVALSSQGSDTVNSSWSAVQDSDDLSDDSSGGEQFFAVGLDLVHAMDSKIGSSEEEIDKKGKTTEENYKRDLKESDSNTWPTKQSWCKTGPYPKFPQPERSHEQNNQPHRPISMQWSDPLANRNMWTASGLGTSHSSTGFGPLQ